MAQKLPGLKKYAFSSASQLKERNLPDPFSYTDFQIRKQNSVAQATASKEGGFNEKFSTKSKGQTLRDSEELNRRYFIVGERRISSYWWASVFFFGGLGFLITGISSYLKYNLFTGVYRAIEVLVNKGPVLLSHPFLIKETGGESLIFFPQGLLLCFYGSLGLLLSLYWWLLIYWNVGGGFNEFNKKEGFMRIFRWGYPGKNRRIDIVYPLKDIEAIRVELNQTPGSGLLASEQTIFIRLLSTPTVDPTLLGEKRVSSSADATLATQVLALLLPPKGEKERKQGIDKLKVKREIPLGGIGQPLTLKEIEKQASELANYLQVALEGL